MKLTSYTAKEKKGKQSRADGWRGKKLTGNVTLNPKKISYRCKPGRLTVLPLCILSFTRKPLKYTVALNGVFI